ncbi:serine/threonine-protein kinase [Nocardioides antri]|uniref:non-specific serine/threonine protein kinase n=1 Tax=Nocardioides antri TaxID=2607659 RepID=A0A5B1LYF9_9ACTN|nr:serine/threonine-protein kinase [Nocardioides antri]KAA1425586.1 serine/threonine protein kinase [Nocardioides antri]
MTTQPQHESPPRVGDYTLLTRLGEGGMGIVHLARNADGRRVALKVLRPHIVGDEEARARLAREVDTLTRVRSPWIAEFLDADPWADVPYVVTRYVPGLSLHDHVVEEGPVRERDLMWLAGCLAEGVAAVHHAGVLHRDIKPSNVLMEGRTPILIDFGLARVADDPRLTQAGWLLGTPGYLAPEILYGDDATPAADVHAWAATVAYGATGRPPYGRGPSMAIMDRARRGEHDLAGIEGPLAAVLDASLDPDPLARPSLAELLAWLRPHSTQPDAPLVPPPVEGHLVDDDDFTLPVALANGGSVAPLALSEPRTAETVSEPRPVTRMLTTPVAPGPAPPPAPPTIAPPAWGQPPPAVEQWEQEWDARLLGHPKVAFAERFRRGAAVACGGLALGAATALAPYLTGAAVVLGVWLLRTGSLAASAGAHRRTTRGTKWYDAPQVAFSTPWHSLRAITGTAVLLLWSLGLALAAALLCYAAALDGAATLFTGGSVLGMALWSGPGASRFRSPLSRVVYPLTSTWRRWLPFCAVLLLLAGVLGLVVVAEGVHWVPASSPPFGI